MATTCNCVTEYYTIKRQIVIHISLSWWEDFPQELFVLSGWSKPSVCSVRTSICVCKLHCVQYTHVCTNYTVCNLLNACCPFFKSMCRLHTPVFLTFSPLMVISPQFQNLVSKIKLDIQSPPPKQKFCSIPFIGQSSNIIRKMLKNLGPKNYISFSKHNT